LHKDSLNINYKTRPQNYEDREKSLTLRIQAGLKRRTIHDLFLYFPTIIIQGIIGLLIASLLSKLFAPDQYGNYVLAHGIYNLLGTLSGMWMHLSIIRLLPEYKAKGIYDTLVVTLIYFEISILIFITLIGATTLFISGAFLNRHLFSLLLIAVFGYVFNVCALSIESFYMITGQPGKYSIVVLYRILCGLIVGLIFALWFNMGIVGFFLGLVFPNVCLMLWFIWIKKKRLINIFSYGSFSMKALRDAMSYSLPFVGMNLTALILGISDHYIIGGYLSSYEVGIYAICYLIANQGIQIFITVLMKAADPIAIKTWEEHGLDPAYNYLIQLFRYYTILAIPALIGLSVLGSELISIFSTPEYAIGAPVIIYVGFGMLFHGYTQLQNRVFILSKKTVTPLLNFTLISILNVSLNILIVPRFGYIAAAWTTLISYFLLFIITFITARRVLELKWWDNYIWKVLISSCGMGLIVYFSKEMFTSIILNLFLSIFIGVGCYSVLIILLKGINDTEKQQIISKSLQVIRRYKAKLSF